MNGIGATEIIIAITALISFRAFSNVQLRNRLLLNPYLVHNEKDYLRLIGHGLIHNDFMHLAFNMFIFYMFGKPLELFLTNNEKFNEVLPNSEFWGYEIGLGIYLFIYIGAIFFAAIPALSKHKYNPQYNSLGASGATSAILLAYIVVFPLNRIGFFFIPMPAFVAGILFLVYEQVMNKRSSTNVAHDAHIYGALFGILAISICDTSILGNFFDQIDLFFERL